MNNGMISHEGTKTRKDQEELSRIVVNCGYRRSGIFLAFIPSR